MRTRSREPVLSAILAVSILWLWALTAAAKDGVGEAAGSNRFVPLGTINTGKMARDAAPVKAVWVDHAGAALFWPEAQNHEADFFLYRPGGKPAISRTTGTFKDEQYINRLLISPLACCYLPKAKRVLFFQPRVRFKPAKDPTTWLLDPDSGVWEAVAYRTAMSPMPGEYDPTFRRGRAASGSLWGDLVYDPIHGEAVLFGGAGVWGRTSAGKIDVKPGDWILDEQTQQYRLLWPDTNIKKAVRWFPGRCGTWTFSEETKKWSR